MDRETEHGSSPRILVVDDEPSITDLVSTVLRYEGFQVEAAPTGRKALKAVTSFRPHLVVLDVMLPDLDGFEVQRRLAADGLRMPILFLTARDATEDKVRGLTMGADDYVTKPFAFEELLARVEALGRRPKAMAPPVLQVADLVLDTASREVRRGGGRIELTPKEYAVLEYLMRSQGRVMSRTLITEYAWDYHFDPGTNIVDVVINRLRKKIDAGHGKKLLHTVRGVGYVIRG